MSTLAFIEFDQDLSVVGFPPPIEERPGPERAEGDVDMIVGLGTSRATNSSSTAVVAGATDFTTASVVEVGGPLLESERGAHNADDSDEDSHGEEQCKIFYNNTLCYFVKH